MEEQIKQITQKYFGMENPSKDIDEMLKEAYLAGYEARGKDDIEKLDKFMFTFNGVVDGEMQLLNTNRNKLLSAAKEAIKTFTHSDEHNTLVHRAAVDGAKDQDELSANNPHE